MTTMAITDTTDSAPEAVLRRLINEGFSEGRLEVADELVSDHCVEHQNYGPGHAPGAEGVRSVIGSLRAAFPDFQLVVEDVAVHGDVVWARNVASGTNHGSFMGHPPTGRSIRVDVIDVVRVRDGRIVEHWGVPDRLSALMQLGLAPSPQRQ
jgi:predicted ester cyclase